MLSLSLWFDVISLHLSFSSSSECIIHQNEQNLEYPQSLNFQRNPNTYNIIIISSICQWLLLRWHYWLCKTNCSNSKFSNNYTIKCHKLQSNGKCKCLTFGIWLSISIWEKCTSYSIFQLLSTWLHLCQDVFMTFKLTKKEPNNSYSLTNLLKY